MNKTIRFRNLLAERGIETNPEEAEKLYLAAKKFVRHARKISIAQIWSIEKDHPEIAKLLMIAKDG
jgi:hypothetical protein